MNSTIIQIIEQARKEWPPCFALSEIDRISGGALRRRTIHNMRARKEIPESCFFMQSRKKLLVSRNELLSWWLSQLSTCEDK